MTHPIRIGAKLVPQGTTIPALRAFWRLADESGFDHIWVYDHMSGVGNAALTTPQHDIEIFEGWTLLAAVASETKHARLGAMVTANTFRHPGMLAKIATTVDHLSHGRLEFGIGTGWGEYEHAMFALPLGGPRERIDRLDEAIRLIKALWSPEVHTDFAGEHYTADKAVHSPKPLQTPHPPIWMGGTGEKRMLKLVAEHADVWNAVANVGPASTHLSGVLDRAGAAEGARLSGVLDRWCEEVGRNPDEIRRSVQLRPDPARVADDVAPWIEAGFSEIVLFVAPEQLPELRALG